MLDLAIAVAVGVIVPALVFAWKHAKHIEVETYTDEEGYKVYDLRGPLFFGSVSHFRELFDPGNDPEHVVLEFRRSRVSDHSGIEALDNLAAKYKAAGKPLHLRHLSPECRQLLKKAGNLYEVNVLEDPKYHVASDVLAKAGQAGARQVRTCPVHPLALLRYATAPAEFRPPPRRSVPR